MVSTNTETALLGLTNAGGFLAESSALADTMNELGGSSETCTTSAVLCTPDAPCEAPISECQTDEVTTADLSDAQAQVKDSIHSLVDQLSERFFTEDNIETAEDKSITYLLGPDDLCDDVETTTLNSDGTVAASSAGPDPDCVDSATRAAVRLRVTSPSEGDVDVTVVLTDQRFEPFVFELHKQRLAVTADLDQLTSSIEAMGEDLGGLESLRGRLQLELVKNAPLDFSARFNVLDDVELVAVDNGNRLEVSVGASSPTLEARIDGNAKTVSASYGLGPVRVSGPLALFADMFGGTDESGDALVAANGEPVATPPPAEPAKTYTGVIEAVLGGLDGTLSYDGASDAFSLSNLGLGDETTTVTHDGNPLFALDVNPDSGRHFDLTLQDTTSGLEVTFSPTLDVSALFAFENIADQVDVPAALMNDTFRLFFDGQNPSVRGRDNGLEVTSGTLHLSSSAHPEDDVTVSAGMCLLSTTESDSAAVADSSAPADTAPLPAGTPVDPAPVTQPETTADEERLLSAFSAGTCE
jgi:hypothetical protein